MSATTAAPAFHFVVVSPFLTYAKGDVITDPAAIAKVEASHLPNVVRIAAPSA